MSGKLDNGERVRTVEFLFLLAVGALRSARSDSRLLSNAFDRISSLKGRDLAINALNRSLRIPISALIAKKRENDPHPDTGESGETYDVEAFGRLEWSSLR